MKASMGDATLFYHCVMPDGRQWVDGYGRLCLTEREAEAYMAEVQRRFKILMGIDPGACRWVKELLQTTPELPPKAVRRQN